MAQDFDLKSIESHYTALSKKYGFTLTPSADALDHVARTLQKQGQTAAALEVLQRNTREHPWIAETFAHLGDALGKAGRPKEALEAYKEARRVAVEDENPYGDPLEDYREAEARLLKKEDGAH